MSLAEAVQMKGLGFLVVLVYVDIDGLDEFHHIAKDAAPHR